MWKKINFNTLNIKKETEKAILIKLPSQSKYGDYMFWHPSKLVRDEGGRGYYKSFSYTDDFTFKIFKNGKGKTNRFKKLDEIELDPGEIEEAFKNSHYEEEETYDSTHYYEVIHPEKLIVSAEIEECLKNK